MEINLKYFQIKATHDVHIVYRYENVFVIFAGMKAGRQIMTVCVCTALLLILAAADMIAGRAAPSPQVLWLLRAPRVATAILAGAALAAAGTQMQSVLRNPLADPHIMGVSAGASLGAAIATLSGAGLLPVTGAAFAGAFMSAMIILYVSKRFSSASTLLIFGVMLGFIVNAAVSILQSCSDAESLKLFYSWSAGNFTGTTWFQIIIMTIALAAGSAIAFSNRKGLDIILFGDEFAAMAGAGPQRLRFSALLSSCLLTGAVTAFCGPVGFVGIVAPHIARGLLKSSAHKLILPFSMLIGALTGITADLLSQSAPVPLPVASTMAFVGIPIILYIILKGNRE